MQSLNTARSGLPQADQDKSKRQDVKFYFLAALFLANTLIWQAVFFEERNGVMTVAFLDVGQGDAILTVWTEYSHLLFG